MMRFPQTYLKYVFKPSLRSRRFADILKNAPIDLGISFVKLSETEFFKVYQEVTEHRLQVNKVFTITPDPIKLYSSKFEEFVEIPVPSSDLGVHPIYCRLLSKYRREGMVRGTRFCITKPFS